MALNPISNGEIQPIKGGAEVTDGTVDATDVAVLATKMDHLQKDVDKMSGTLTNVDHKVDRLNEESPVYRIDQLEKWRDGVRKLIAALVVGLIITWGGIILEWILSR